MNKMSRNTLMYSMKKQFRLLCFAILLLWMLPATAAEDLLKVYYVRHAEGGHNVTSLWQNTPKEQRPSYVGNSNMFTPKGEKQVEELTEKLKGMKFDFIAVSPIWRTRNTIIPYLKASGQKGEIWPELAETGNVPAEWTIAGKFPQPDAKLFENGKAIKLPETEQPFFTLRNDCNYLLNTNGENSEQSIANALAMAQKTVDMIKTRFSKSGKTLLLVGHGNSGSTLLRVLTAAKEINSGLKNTGIWMAEEQPDGSFKLKILNDKPYSEQKKHGKPDAASK